MQIIQKLFAVIAISTLATVANAKIMTDGYPDDESDFGKGNKGGKSSNVVSTTF